MVSPNLQHEIEQFLYTEAKLLDDRKFEQWYELLAEDLRYFMPLRSNPDTDGEEYSRDDESAYFDDDKAYIGVRIKRLMTGRAWAEEPPSRTRHMVSNVRARRTGEGQYEVDSVFYVYRSRLERQVDEYVGGRHDVLRKTDSGYGWEIARRTIHLDQATLATSNISIFF